LSANIRALDAQLVPFGPTRQTEAGLMNDSLSAQFSRPLTSHSADFPLLEALLQLGWDDHHPDQRHGCNQPVRGE
jgi:hypothetical protein